MFVKADLVKTGCHKFIYAGNIQKPRFMIKSYLFIFSALSVLSSCGSETGKNEKKGLAGTWRLIGYTDFDSIHNKWTYPYGNNPKGYFTYTKNGIVNLNGSAEKPLAIPGDSLYAIPLSLGEVLDNAFGYFGTYTIDTVNSTVTHHVKGGSVIPYIGTDQPRQFILKGDTLLIGDPTFEIGKRVLVREE